MGLDYATDPQPEAVAQWHGTPDLDLGETYCSPPVCIYVENGHYIIWIKTSAKAVNATLSGGQSFSVLKSFDVGPVQKGVWVDWAFHIKWSWKSDGLVEVWKNKVKVVTYANAPSMCNDKQYPYFKLGIYKWPWMNPTTASKSTVSKRVLYVDEVRIGTSLSNLDDVSPAGTTPTPTPTTPPVIIDTVPAPGSTTTSFTLVNASTDKDIKTLTEGTIIHLSDGKYLNIRANSSAGVVFQLSGAQTVSHTETGAPYALFGDVSGNYNSWTPVPGSYKLVATPSTGAAFTVNFQVVN